MGEDYQQYPLAKGNHPFGWVETTVGEVMLEIRSGYSSGKHLEAGHGIPHLRPMNVSPDGEISMKDVRYVSPRVGILRLSKDDVLFTNTSSTAWVGKTALVEKPGDWGFSNHMTRLRVADGMSPEFVARHLHYLCLSGYFAFHCRKHINQSSVARNQLAEEVPFRLPPAKEQNRIAAKLRHLLTRERKLRQQLEALAELIHQYRATVLQAACAGRLVPTEAELARKERRDFESVSVLLERILVERRAKWEVDQLAKMRATGKAPKDDKWKRRYKEPIRPQTDSLPPLPPKWSWAGTEELTACIEHAMTIGPFGSNLKVKDYQKRGVPLVFVREIRSENFRRSDTRYISPKKARELASHKVRGGDLLITKMGEPPGDTSIYPLRYPDAIATADCVKLTPNLAVTSAEYLKYIIRSPVVKEQVLAISRGIAQQKMSLARFKTIAIPLPPIAEQRRIVSQIDHRFAAIGRIESQIKTVLKETASLRVSLFHYAVSGRLVAQNRSNEPASRLLLRIRSERERRLEQAMRKKPNRKAKMKKLSPETVKQAISKLPKDRFTFDELSEALQAEYDPLKDIVFNLLDEVKPSLKQVFDAKAHEMHLQRIKQ